MDALVEMLADKPQTGSGAESLVRAAVAQAEGLERGGPAYVRETTRDAWTEACATGRFSPRTSALTRLANSTASEHALRAVDLAYTTGGGASIYRRRPLRATSATCTRRRSIPSWHPAASSRSGTRCCHTRCWIRRRAARYC